MGGRAHTHGLKGELRSLFAKLDLGNALGGFVIITFWSLYDKVSGVVESLMQFASKTLTPRKGRCQKRFSGIRPLRGSPPLLTENQPEKKKVFFLSGKGVSPPPP